MMSLLTPLTARHEIEHVHTSLPSRRPAVADYAMIKNGDKVMVCLSGGKDSNGLLAPYYSEWTVRLIEWRGG